MHDPVEVFLEVGDKRTFASAVDWPGWSRSGKDRQSALEALLSYAPRYEGAIGGAALGFHTPAALSEFQVVQKLKGNASTDFGAPGGIPKADEAPLGTEELRKWKTILLACWEAFDIACTAAKGRDLRKGPRGGGRAVAAIVRHVLEADRAYLSKLGWTYTLQRGESDAAQMQLEREAVLEGIRAAVGGEVPSQGPRGGKRWPVRYFFRRSAWHLLDHAWEIEDRLT